MENYKFTCKAAENCFHDYHGSLTGCKTAASKYYDSSVVIEIFDTLIDNETGSIYPINQVAVKRNGKWTNI